MIGREIPNTFLESPDIVLSLVPDPNWYLKVDQISPTLTDIIATLLLLSRKYLNEEVYPFKCHF